MKRRFGLEGLTAVFWVGLVVVSVRDPGNIVNNMYSRCHIRCQLGEKELADWIVVSPVAVVSSTACSGMYF